MGIINVSPESFFKGSVLTSAQEVARAAAEMQAAGAHIIDIGAMSTAPYLDTVIPVEKEVERLRVAIRAAKEGCDLPISADTPRAEAARAAAEEGADAINDVTGLKYDARMAPAAAAAGLPVIAGAYYHHDSTAPAAGGVTATVAALQESIAIAKKAGIKRGVVVDPSIGFFRKEGKGPFFTRTPDSDRTPWYERDLEVLSNIDRLVRLGPVCVSASRKSFIGHLLNLASPEDRLVPSIACEIVAAINGASIIRTHSVRETVQALTMLQLLSRSGKRL